MTSELTGRQQEALLCLGEECPALRASEQLESIAREDRSPSPFLLSFVGAKLVSQISPTSTPEQKYPLLHYL